MTSDRRPNAVSVADAALFLNITERAVKSAALAGAVPFRYAGPEMVLAVEDLLDFATRLVFEPSDPGAPAAPGGEPGQGGQASPPGRRDPTTEF